jgi:SAM-dependent methyltransferase
MVDLRRLNVGCGRDVKAGWINLDSMPLHGVDTIADLERCKDVPLPFDDDSIDEFLLSHIIEHINNPLPLMQELHRIAKPGARATIRCPYGSTDEAFEDPTHVRQYFLGSFLYFSQPGFWRADYGYRGDWHPERITLLVDRAQCDGLSAQQIFEKVSTLRNVVREMIADLVAVKPIREPRLELQRNAELSFTLA